MKRCLLAVVSACLLALAGCGSTKTVTFKLNAGPPACPLAAAGHGSLGACAPKQSLGLTVPRTITNQPTYPDRSNNDPCYCGAQIKAAGQVGLIAKANQGTGFIDQTAVGMIQSARAQGLAVGLYDFDQDYTVAEAQVLVARAHAAGIYPSTPRTFPLYLDVEYGNFNYGGLLAQIAFLRAQGYRVGIYTGDWYWGPHAGCRWPQGVSAWLSGYPSAPVPCGTTDYLVHQFTSTPIDMNVFLGSRAAFDSFVLAAPKPPLARWKRAQAASLRAYDRRGCPVLAQRDSWFAGQLRRHPRVRTVSRRHALAASRRAYRQRSCGLFNQRAEYFAALIRKAGG